MATVGEAAESKADVALCASTAVDEGKSEDTKESGVEIGMESMDVVVMTVTEDTVAT